jgi:hypothetical protein
VLPISSSAEENFNIKTKYEKPLIFYNILLTIFSIQLKKVPPITVPFLKKNVGEHASFTLCN